VPVPFRCSRHSSSMTPRLAFCFAASVVATASPTACFLTTWQMQKRRLIPLYRSHLSRTQSNEEKSSQRRAALLQLTLSPFFTHSVTLLPDWSLKQHERRKRLSTSSPDRIPEGASRGTQTGGERPSQKQCVLGKRLM